MAFHSRYIVETNTNNHSIQLSLIETDEAGYTKSAVDAANAVVVLSITVGKKGCAVPCLDGSPHVCPDITDYLTRSEAAAAAVFGITRVFTL